MSRKMVSHDGNSAVAHVAHATNEVIAIYPITPSSPMGEIADTKSAAQNPNIWGTIPHVSELQSEGGASGSVHGALTSGALTTTFTASQGLLLMLPNMYKIAGELLPTVFHIAARAVACQALSIFGDHSDVMAARMTGFAMLSSANVQEAMDFSLIAQEATLQSRIPFLHFFEGFRTSHEIQKVEELTYDDMKSFIDFNKVLEHRARGLSPDHPVIRGTSQNPDVFFQGRESVNQYYDACADKVTAAMDKFAKMCGRQYNLFDYVGDAEAERVLIVLGSAAETTEETMDYLRGKGEKVGVVKVRLFRPFSAYHLLEAIPATATKIAVLDMTKEPGSLGEPLYEDVRTAFGEEMSKGNPKFRTYPKIVGGRHGLGLSHHGTTPAMIKSVFDNLKEDHPRNHFTIGIHDDVTHTNLEWDNQFNTESDKIYKAMFYGLGSDGTVGANKNSIKIIANKTDNNAQGYFVYDSKKAGAMTVSHLRFGKEKIRSHYLIQHADFLACHNFSFVEKYNMLNYVKEGGTFLLAAPYKHDDVWQHLPLEMQTQIIDKKLKFYVINAVDIAEKLGLGARINVIMQTAFFKISQVIDEKLALDSIREAIEKSYGKKGGNVVKMNNDAVDEALTNIFEVNVPKKADSSFSKPALVPGNAPEFVREVTGTLIAQEGDELPVSKMPDDGTWMTGTTQYEKRNIAINIPVWNPETCIQCGQCSMVCPHGVIRPKVYDPKELDKAPATWKSADAKGKNLQGYKYTLQVSPEDCTGCGSCVDNCPAKEKEAIKMQPQVPLREQERDNWEFFLSLPDTDPNLYKLDSVKGSQFIRPLFEFSGACAGCGETAYVKLMSQLFGDRAMIANATGCSSIYGGNLPTTPYTKRNDGIGPAWNNSLFEDNAEMAFGMRLTVDKFHQFATELCQQIKTEDSSLNGLVDELLNNPQKDQAEIENQRSKVAELKTTLKSSKSDAARQLISVADYLVKKSVWALGGDGWAYDIGYGGLDHVLASGKNVNILVLDTEVYSNTGGQASKSTPMGAVAKFAASGKPVGKKDLGYIAMTYGYIYVARVAMGGNLNQVVKAFTEAERYDGPSLILAYSHCIAHGINMTTGLQDQKAAVESGHWPLYRFNPELISDGQNPLKLDSKEPSIDLQDYVYKQNRYAVLKKSNPEMAKKLLETAQRDITGRYSLYKQLEKLDYSAFKG